MQTGWVSVTAPVEGTVTEKLSHQNEQLNPVTESTGNPQAPADPSITTGEAKDHTNSQDVERRRGRGGRGGYRGRGEGFRGGYRGRGPFRSDRGGFEGSTNAERGEGRFRGGRGGPDGPSNNEHQNERRLSSFRGGRGGEGISHGERIEGGSRGGRGGGERGGRGYRPRRGAHNKEAGQGEQGGHAAKVPPSQPISA